MAEESKEAIETEEIPTENTAGEENMEDILHSIRDIIAEDEDGEKKEDIKVKAEIEEVPSEESTPVEDDDDDILELTEVVEEPVPEVAVEGVIEEPPIETIDEVAESPAETAIEEENIETIDEPPAPEPEAAVEPIEEVEVIQDESIPEEPAMEAEPEVVPTEEPAMEAEPEVVPEPEAPPQEEAQPAESLISEEPAKATEIALKSLMDSIPKPKIESPEFRSGNTVEDLALEALRPMLSEWLDKNLPIIVEELVQKEIRKLVPRD